MAVSKEHNKHLAHKHGKTITGHELEQAHNYVNGIKKSLLKELDKLENEYEASLKRAKGDSKIIHMAERNYSHWRHIIISVFETLQDASHHWHYVGQGLTGKKVKHPPRWTGTH
ncbi:hypothetical protein PXY30_004450 [Salmonella enterica]|nr:hypothetical protein [Salmonella enterica]